MSSLTKRMNEAARRGREKRATVSHDPTMELINSFDDDSRWAKIVKGMPIFIEHDGYEVYNDAGVSRLVVVPKGDNPPEGGKKVFSIDRQKLQETADAINKNLNSHGKAIKLFLGTGATGAHSDPKAPQNENPTIVGYGKGAYLGEFGPNRTLAVKTDAFYSKGHEGTATEYPERSPEFLPRTGAITGVALLKTDPRLPMGQIAYDASDEPVYRYGVGFMSDTTVDADMDLMTYAEETAIATPDDAKKVAKTAKHAALEKKHGHGALALAKVINRHAPKGMSNADKQKMVSSGGEHMPASVHSGNHPNPNASHGSQAEYHTDLLHHHLDHIHEAPDEFHAKMHAVHAKHHASMIGHHNKWAARIGAHEAKGAKFGDKEKEDYTAELDEIRRLYAEEMAAAESSKSNEDDDSDDEDEGDTETEGSEGEHEPLEDHEQKFADRLMSHWQKTHPAIKHLCDQHKKHCDSQAAMSQDDGAKGKAPVGKPGGEGKDDADKKKDYSDDEETMQDTEARNRIAALEEENARLYAEKEVNKLVTDGFKIKDKPKEVERLVKMTPQERKERLDEIRLNYAREQRAPVSRTFLPLDDKATETAEANADQPTPEEAGEIILYAEQENIDISVESGYVRALQKMRAEKKSA